MIRYIYKSSELRTDARLYKIFDKDGVAVGEVYNPREAGAQVFDFSYFKTGAKLRLAFYFRDTNQEIPELLRTDPAYAEALNGKYAGIVRRGMITNTMRIFEGDRCIGGIIADLSEQGVYQIEYRGRRFTSYLASYGNDGSYLCVYDDRRCLIGEIRRFLPGYREYACYTVFAEEDGWEELLNFLTIHIDMMEYSENLHGDSGRIGHSGFCLRGHEFHNPQYIERIAAAEGVDITRRMAGIAYGTESDAWENNRMPAGERNPMPFGEPQTGDRNVTRTARPVHGHRIGMYIVAIALILAGIGNVLLGQFVGQRKVNVTYIARTEGTILDMEEDVDWGTGDDSDDVDYKWQIKTDSVTQWEYINERIYSDHEIGDKVPCIIYEDANSFGYSLIANEYEEADKYIQKYGEQEGMYHYMKETQESMRRSGSIFGILMSAFGIAMLVLGNRGKRQKNG